jgi:transcriptional regulator with XRE-family HTH domain
MAVSVPPVAAEDDSLEGIGKPAPARFTTGMTLVAETSSSSDRFGSELRRWRTTRHWSQLDLSLRAGTTQRYLSFLEQGRSRPGRGMVVRLAESMGLSLRERNSLLLAAGYAPVFTESSLDDPAVRPVRDALSRIIEGHMPYPAVVTQPYGVVVAANQAVGVLTEGVADWLLEPPVNVLRLALHPEGMARRVENMAQWGRHVTESLRNQALRSPDPRLDDFVAELEGYIPAGSGSGSGSGDADPLGFAVPLRLRSDGGELHLITTLTSFATATDVTLSELHLEAFLPADATTAQLLQTRASESPHGHCTSTC